VLNAKGRLGRICDVADAYIEIAHERFGRIEVDVFTAEGELDAGQLESLQNRIVTRLGREPVFHQHVDKTMIGGLILRIGDQLIDGSVRGRLRRLREDLRNDGAATVRDQPERFLKEESD
ncbi:MAG: ATP synthase F1 subunit delta, partial [Phycisphaerales bacterium]|nr:ATP synthase F1 subunit delta [Phycisphaerales bacterium]